MNRILALARISMRAGIQIPSSKRVCSIVMCEPRSTRARNNPIETGWVTSPSTLTHPKVLLVDPELTLHFGHHLAVRATRAIASARRRPKHVRQPAVDDIFAN